MKKAALVLILLVSLPVAGMSQYKTDDKPLTISESLRLPMGNGNGLLLGLIDMSKIDMSQSYFVGFGSGGGQSNSYGLYMNRLLYPVSDKVIINMNLGYVHNPFQSFQGPSPAAFQNRFVGSGEINYFPTENTHLRFSISNIPQSRYDPYSRYRRY